MARSELEIDLAEILEDLPLGTTVSINGFVWEATTHDHESTCWHNRQDHADWPIGSMGLTCEILATLELTQGDLIALCDKTGEAGPVMDVLYSWGAIGGKRAGEPDAQEEPAAPRVFHFATRNQTYEVHADSVTMEDGVVKFLTSEGGVVGVFAMSPGAGCFLQEQGLDDAYFYRIQR